MSSFKVIQEMKLQLVFPFLLEDVRLRHGTAKVMGLPPPILCEVAWTLDVQNLVD